MRESLGREEEGRRRRGGEGRDLAQHVLVLYPPQLGHILPPVTFIAMDCMFQTASLSILEHQEPFQIKPGLPNTQGIGVTPQPVTLAQLVRARGGPLGCTTPQDMTHTPHDWALCPQYLRTPSQPPSGISAGCGRFHICKTGRMKECALDNSAL